MEGSKYCYTCDLCKKNDEGKMLKCEMIIQEMNPLECYLRHYLWAFTRMLEEGTQDRKTLNEWMNKVKKHIDEGDEWKGDK